MSSVSDTRFSTDPKTLANESTCQECGHIELHDMDHPGFRPDWLRDAMSGNRCQRSPSDVEIAEGYSVLAAAIKEIAGQRLCHEMDKDERETACYETGFEEVVKLARGAFLKSQRKAAGTADEKPDGQADTKEYEK